MQVHVSLNLQTLIDLVDVYPVNIKMDFPASDLCVNTMTAA